jgi:predicted amidohydrolase YtcJ
MTPIAFFRRAALLMLPFVFVACSNEPKTPFADLAFVNARVYTVDETRPWAEAVAVRGDTIVYVGDEAGVGPFIGPDTVVRDLGDKLMLPGFIEAHMHFMSAASTAGVLELNIEQSIDEWLAALEEYAAANPELPIIFGYGFIASAFGDAGPHRDMIDPIVPDRPVIIMDEGWHTAWLNTAALEALNVTQDTQDITPGYAYYKRDENGDATGYLLEDVAGRAADILFPPSEDKIVAGLGLMTKVMNSMGITTAFDPSAMEFKMEFIKRTLDRVSSQGELTVRVFGAATAKTVEDVDVAVDRAVQWGEHIKGDGFHYNALKIFSDGTLEARTGAMFEDYQGDPGNSGHTVFTEAQLAKMMTEAASRGIDVHVHALGERAIHESLNAVSVARKAYPDSRTHYVLIHLEIVAEQDIPRFAELGVFAQTSPLWFSYDEPGKQFVSEDQFQRYWPVRSLENAGARLAFGSDFPATGLGLAGLNPLLNIEIGHTRQIPGEPDSLVQPRESERLSIESLVRGYTLGPAQMLHLEDQVGSLEVGKKADLIVLDQDIFEIDKYSIHKTKVALTLMNGQVVHEL